MSVHSQHAPVNRRMNSLQQTNGDRRNYSRQRRKSVDGEDAYRYALGVAYLAYLLQPRQKRKRTIEKKVTRAGTSTSIQDLMTDFHQTQTQNSKSDKYPHDFVKALDKRLQAIIKGEDKRPEYQDPVVKRSFAVFFTHFSDPTFKKQCEESKRAEDLILLFFSKATGVLSLGKPAHDEGVKRMVDRHLALFVRLMSTTLKEKGWADERKDLAARLTSLETKLYKHEEDLSSTTETEKNVVEEEVPLSYEIKDMPFVNTVGRIFNLPPTMLQSDVVKHKSTWTEEAAIRDLKTYQTHLNMGIRGTLNESDFDTRDAFEEWKKTEAPELSQMLLAIIQINPMLAKTSAGVNVSQAGNSRASVIADAQYAELAKSMAEREMPDLHGLQIADHPLGVEDTESIFTFIPSDPRGYFRYITNLAIMADADGQLHSDQTGTSGVLSKASTDFLVELAARWRIPKFSRMVLFLDCVREKFAEQMLTLDQLDRAFNFAKEPVIEADSKHKRASLITTSLLNDRFKWTISDFSLMQQILSGVYDSLLRELFGAMMTCYDNKQSPLLGPLLAVIDEHIKNDPSFTDNPENFENFKQQVSQGLHNKARESYAEFVEKEIPGEQDTWEFFHIMQLGKKVLEKLMKIQKRYRKNPQILGIEPLTILMEIVLPAYAEDSKAMIDSVIETSRAREQEVPIDDGFELYKELANFRRVHGDALPNVTFPWKLEDVLQEFVWKWINATDSQVMGWVEQAIRHDNFETRNEDRDRPPTEDERHSNSVLDIFRSFNQVIEQIVKLEWDDDLTYAKFMTALSKSLGNGIAKYCNVLDAKFHEEMDSRQTPEQEQALTQSTQAKYLKYAKDAWNNDTQIEPFQFYSRSFVKLNNISFGIQQWDKLESEMNVDACADVIKRHNPSSLHVKKKVTNYVFTVKIVEAEGLKALDVNGFSDPYVVLSDEYQKRLFKTKTIYRNLDPRWDETVDIATQGPLNLIATVWDWDSMKDPDYVGRTSLKLDPSHFGDFLPREYWLNLDTQGRILFRVSMEGERDDIQFYFGKAFRSLQRTQRDMTRTITDKLSAYISSCLSIATLRRLTNKGISIAKVSGFISSYRNRANPAPTTPTGPSENEIDGALTPLFKYFDDNFFIMNQTLTPDAMIAVMTRLWKEVLSTIEGLLVPALSDVPSQQKPLSQPELDIVFKWLQSLFEFFNAVDPETGQANGVSMNVLKSPKYHEVQTLNFFYFDTTENLIRTSERMASATAQSHQAQRSRVSAPAGLGAASSALLMPGAAPGAKRAKSIMLARNLGTMRKAKEEKWKAAQAEPSDDMILRILRMRPEAAGYLKDRSRQKERLAAAAAAEQIVRASLLAGGGRMTGPSVMRRER